MTVGLKDHCHLGAVCPPTSNTYTVKFEETAPVPMVVASARRALTGRLHYHVLSDGGAPVVMKETQGLPLLLSSQAELDTVVGLLGKTVYYVPNYHDDFGTEPVFTYIRKCKFAQIGGISRTDAMEQYWTVLVILVDAESHYGEVLDTEVGSLSYQGNDTTAAEFRDADQDFSEWETAASSTAGYLLAVTNSDSTITWGYMGMSNNNGADIDIYDDIGLTTRGWNGVVPAYGVKTPSSYEVREA